MIKARRNRIGIGVECQIEGNTVEIVGELAAMIKAVRKGLEKYYDETAVNEVIVNIGRAAYSDRPQQVEELCIPLLGKNKIGGGAKAWVNTKKPRPRSQTCARYA